MVVTTLDGTAGDVGLVNGARWLPYMLFRLVAGAVVERLRRRPVMIGADLVRSVLLLMVPALALTDSLSIWALAGFMGVSGWHPCWETVPHRRSRLGSSLVRC